MQETESSVENTAAMGAAGEESSAVTKKSKKIKKSPKIPTVSEIVESESQENEINQKNDAIHSEEKNVEQLQSEEKTAEKTEDKTGEEKTAVESEVKSDEVKENVNQEDKENSLEKTDYPEEDEDAFERSENERIIAGFSLEKETALVETVLFLESEPQNAEKLSIITKLSVEVVNEAISKLKEKYTNADSGIELAEITGGWQLVPKKEMFNLVRERYGKKNGGMLSKAALETLSIIAYSQPITRAEIESLRHVSADNMMRILLDRKFIKEVGKKDVPGKPTLYGTTKEFLEFFHLQNISELPQLDEMDSERFVLAR